MKAVYLVCVFNQEKVLVGAFSVIVQLHRLIDLRHVSRRCVSCLCLCPLSCPSFSSTAPPVPGSVAPTCQLHSAVASRRPLRCSVRCLPGPVVTFYWWLQRLPHHNTFLVYIRNWLSASGCTLANFGIFPCLTIFLGSAHLTWGQIVRWMLCQ